MKGLLIYDSVGYARNSWFISELTRHAKVRGIDIDTLIYHGSPAEIDRYNIDFVIIRTIDDSLHAYCDSRRLLSFNNSTTARIANDKWQTYLLCKELDIPVMPTLLAPNAGDIDYPCIVKSRDGHGGNEVFMIHDAREYASVVSKIRANRMTTSTPPPLTADKDNIAGPRYIVQDICDTPGKDMRVYLLGGRVLAAVLRSSTVDFRSNYSLGGEVLLTSVSASQLAIIDSLQARLASDFVGVDFIQHNGQWILNEIEDAVGCRMLYSLTDIDVAKVYIDYIYEQITS